MFSKDNRHYRATPRTLNSGLTAGCRRVRKDILSAALGVIALGVVYGLLIGWRG